jgi:hypothetical protein
MRRNHLYADAIPVQLTTCVVEAQVRCLITRPGTQPYNFDFVLDLDERLRLLNDQTAVRDVHYGDDVIGWK